MGEHDDLVARLRDGRAPWFASMHVREIADVIEAQAAQIENLRVALEPFARMKCPDSHIPYDGPVRHVACGKCNVCRAAEALR